MSKYMSLIVVWIWAALLPIRLWVANDSSYKQPCMQNCFVFCGFSRFDEAVLLMMFLVLAFWRMSRSIWLWSILWALCTFPIRKYIYKFYSRNGVLIGCDNFFLMLHSQSPHRLKFSLKLVKRTSNRYASFEGHSWRLKIWTTLGKV